MMSVSFFMAYRSFWKFWQAWTPATIRRLLKHRHPFPGIALKIFDHHPEVLALHEPELVLGKSMHRLVAHTTTSTGGFASRDLERARRALLFSSRPLRAVRRRPILRKDTPSGP